MEPIHEISIRSILRLDAYISHEQIQIVLKNHVQSDSPMIFFNPPFPKFAWPWFNELLIILTLFWDIELNAQGSKVFLSCFLGIFLVFVSNTGYRTNTKKTRNKYGEDTKNPWPFNSFSQNSQFVVSDSYAYFWMVINFNLVLGFKIHF